MGKSTINGNFQQLCNKLPEGNDHGDPDWGPCGDLRVMGEMGEPEKGEMEIYHPQKKQRAWE